MEQGAIERFGAVVTALDEALDWPRLGLAYCDEGGLEFFDREQRAGILDAGLMFAADLGGCLKQGGRSLYVGAGVAELVTICFESIVLGRAVEVATLPGFEVDEINRVLAEVAEGLPRYSGVKLEAAQLAGPFDHVWAASVLSDPEAFPALHDRLYERVTDADGATGKGDLVQDEGRALGIVGRVIGHLPGGGVLSTSDEELGLYSGALEQAGFEVIVPENGRLSAIVGDVIRHVSLLKNDSGDAR